MGKVKDFLRRIGRYKYAVTIGLFLLLICFLDQNNLMQRVQHKREIYSLTKEIEHYEGLRDSSVQRLKELANDSSNLERVAREKYRMHLHDEDIFIIQ